MDEIVFPVRVMKILGIKNLILTNGVGSINTDISKIKFVAINKCLKKKPVFCRI